MNFSLSYDDIVVTSKRRLMKKYKPVYLNDSLWVGRSKGGRDLTLCILSSYIVAGVLSSGVPISIGTPWGLGTTGDSGPGLIFCSI